MSRLEEQVTIFCGETFFSKMENGLIRSISMFKRSLNVKFCINAEVTIVAPASNAMYGSMWKEHWMNLVHSSQLMREGITMKCR